MAAHGSAPESSDVTDAFTPSPPTLAQLTAVSPTAGSVLSAAVGRARTERRARGTISAGFDNRLTGFDNNVVPDADRH